MSKKYAPPIPEHKLPDGPLSDDQIQQLYWEVQSRIGLLDSQAPEETKKKLRAISVQLLQIKRKWIGVRNEIESEIPLAVE